MKRFVKSFGALLFIPALAQAHTGGGDGGFLAGLDHPVLGLDHLLAMVSVGILSAQMGGRAIWTVPLTFVVVMVFGGILGIAGVPLISVELGIAFSVFALGLALAAERKFPVIVAMSFVGVFAVFHGHAHGTEIPTLANPALYALGFTSGTALIHLFGVAVGLLVQRIVHGPQLLRVAGVGIAGVGMRLLFG